MSHALRVLVVDDDDAIRELTSAVLVDDGYEVDTAPNGADALVVASDRPPSVILLDMRMPVLDGWGFAHAYRLIPGRHAPIIVVSAARDAAAWAAEISADDVLPKPFDIDELLLLVHRHAHQRSA